MQMDMQINKLINILTNKLMNELINVLISVLFYFLLYYRFLHLLHVHFKIISINQVRLNYALNLILFISGYCNKL